MHKLFFTAMTCTSKLYNENVNHGNHRIACIAVWTWIQTWITLHMWKLTWKLLFLTYLFNSSSSTVTVYCCDISLNELLVLDCGHWLLVFWKLKFVNSVPSPSGSLLFFVVFFKLLLLFLQFVVNIMVTWKKRL